MLYVSIPEYLTWMSLAYNPPREGRGRRKGIVKGKDVYRRCRIRQHSAAGLRVLLSPCSGGRPGTRIMSHEVV